LHVKKEVTPYNEEPNSLIGRLLSKWTLKTPLKFNRHRKIKIKVEAMIGMSVVTKGNQTRKAQEHRLNPCLQPLVVVIDIKKIKVARKIPNWWF